MVIVVMGLVWLYRLGWGSVYDDEHIEEYDEDEDDNDLVVEIVDNKDK
jgi:hypothetical protein